MQERLVDIGGTLAGVDKRQKVWALPMTFKCPSHHALTLHTSSEQRRSGDAKPRTLLAKYGLCVTSVLTPDVLQNMDQSQSAQDFSTR